MMERSDLSILAKSIGRLVREYVSAALVAVSTRLDDLDRRLNSIPAGPRGEKGEKGDKGDPGAPGEQGPSSVGEKGEKGDPGPRGERGERGEPGPKGEPGPSGPRGDPGERGDQGAPGERGERGDTGLPGERGEKGDRGEPGVTGQRGEKGEPGERGPHGEPGLSITGEKGEPGRDGKDGRDGRDGINGKDGRDGERGRDSLEIDILPAIDPAKSYPRGTFAKHQGGLLRALTTTTPADENGIIAGWDVVVDGIREIEVEQNEDHRSFVLKIWKTSEMVSTKTYCFQMPAMIYREIFKEGTEYARGDVVTWAGSAWHCNAESTRVKPGTGSDWKLMVKEGRAGKDGTVGAEGPKGKDGRDGRDLTQMGFDGSKH